MYKLPVDYTKLTQPERRQVREQYIKEQNNLCFYCKLTNFILFYTMNCPLPMKVKIVYNPSVDVVYVPVAPLF